MKLKLSILTLFLSGVITYAQNLSSKTIDHTKFIDVDLTKSITDYGFSKAALTEDLTPLDLGNFQSGKANFLSTISFDKQIAVLNREGYIAIIFLEKEFSSEHEYDIQTEKNEFYNSVVDKVRSKYGLSSTSNKKYTAWTAQDYELTVTKEENNSILITYNNLVISRPNGTGAKTSEEKRNPYTNSKNLEAENTRIMENYLNEFLKRFKEVGIRSFARVNGNAMEIYFEQNQDLSPSYENLKVQKNIKEMELNSLKNTAKHVIADIFQTKKDLEVLNQTGLDKIKFNLDLYYNDGTKAHHTKSLDIYSLVKLDTPIRKKEILDLLK